MIQAAVSKMTNGEKYVCIARTVEKGIGRFGQAKSILSIGLGCEAKYAKEFVYTENIDISDKKTEIPIGVSCRTCDRLDCSQRAFPPLHKKFDIDINTRGVSVYVTDENGCVDSLEVSQTGVNDLNPLAFGLFPNPTTGAITLQVSMEVADVNMQVFDATGRIVFSQDNLIVQNSISFDLSYLSTGTYMMMLSNDEGVSVRRLSIQN